MVVIPESQLVFMRKHRQFKQLMEDNNWQGLLALETELLGYLDDAISDPKRSTRALLQEMSHLIKVYRELSAICYFQMKNQQPVG